ncbi:MAG: Ig-like domain-containing protein [Planctomycetota bacterium]
MSWFGKVVAVGATLFVLTLSGCSKSGGSSTAGTPSLISFSLGRSQISGSNTITAGVFVNEPLIFEFSVPIDPSSVSFDTLQIVRPDTGEFAPGTFEVQGARVIFRPDVTFDRANPAAGLSFGFAFDTRYLVAIPGQPRENLIRSVSGAQIREGATMAFQTAAAGAEDNPFDFFPGTPKVTLIEPEGQPDPTNPEIIVTEVPVDSQVVLEFSEPVNPATVIGPAPGESNTVIVQVDLDGDPSTGGSEDRVRVPGTYFLDISSTSAQLTFRLPAGSSYPGSAVLVVTVGGSVADVAGNQSGATKSFFYSTVFAPPGDVVSIGETFSNNDFEDVQATGARWNQVNNQGVLRAGAGGGFAIHGEFAPTSDVTLNTDSQVMTDLLGRQVTVTDGRFFFSRVAIPSGVTVRGVGSNPLRIFSSGDITVNGTIDVSGQDAAEVRDEETVGGSPGQGGPGGFPGGRGGDAVEGSTYFIASAPCGDDPPGLQPGDGEDGQGPAAGLASIGMTLDEVLCASFTFLVANMSGGGGGGGYATPGETGATGSNFVGCNVPVHDNKCYDAGSGCVPRPPGAGGGQGGPVGNPRLDPLLGGSGGGGTGNNFFESRGNGLGNSNCLPLATTNFNPGTGGGGGGGALLLQAGRRLSIQGNQSGDAEVFANGGSGGPAFIEELPSGQLKPAGVATGGGGSGGGILLQSSWDNSIDASVTINLTRSMVQALGGPGGNRLPDPKFTGGDGGAGRIRIEAVDSSTGIDFVQDDVAPFNDGSIEGDGTIGDYVGTGFSAARSAFYNTRELLPIYQGFSLTLDGVPFGFNAPNNFVNDGSLGVIIAFQGTSANAQGGPSPSAATNWTFDIREVNDRQFVRFLIVFTPGSSVAVDNLRFFFRGR